MLFSSTTFLFLFLPVTLGIYYIMPKRFRNFILLLMSLVFYGWGEPRYIVLMLLSILVGYITGIMAYNGAGRGRQGLARSGLVIAMVYNIGVLAVFKYTDFFISNLNGWFHLGMPLLHLTLPLGISFYSFQMMSYTIDVYRNDAKLQRNIVSLAAYLTLFPQLIAGPIVRYQTVADQIDTRHESFDLFSEGVCRFVVGFGKKVLLANTIGELYATLNVLPASENSVALAWLSSIAFTFQIYFDFSGYSDMAIGLGKMFGFDFLENFDYPYISRSITEFWRRWHISLSSWFRDYVYIPLGGSRLSMGKTIRNIFIVWLLTGFWHGAAWNFIIWGLYFFVLLLIEKLGWLRILKGLPKWIQHLYTLFLVNLSWVIFSYDTLPALSAALKNMFGLGGIPLWNTMSGYYLTAYGSMIAVLIFAATPYPKLFYTAFIKWLENGSGNGAEEAKDRESRRAAKPAGIEDSREAGGLTERTAGIEDSRGAGGLTGRTAGIEDSRGAGGRPGGRQTAKAAGKSARGMAAVILQLGMALGVLFMTTACLASDSFNPFLYFRF